MRVLLVEDEVDIARPLQRALTREGYVVSAVEEGARAIELAKTWLPDVILLDLMLPDIDGREVAREIRETSRVPIIMMTARGLERDRVAGLDSGADDYVVKPFSTPELLARIRAVTRRTAPVEPTDSPVLEYGDLRLDQRLGRFWVAGAEVELSQKEYEIMRILLASAGAIVRRDAITRAVWNLSAADGANSLDVHMSWLRRKVSGNEGTGTQIETIRGVGFRLVGPEG